MANTKVTGDLIASSTIATGNIADNAVTSDKISGITTAHITEGSNLYYTDARARGAVSVSGNALAYNSSTGVITSNFEESPVFTGIITANSSSSGDYVRLYGSSGTGKWDIYGNGANLRISDNESAGILVVDTGATFGGNVGIGTTSPDASLDIEPSSGDADILLTAGSQTLRLDQNSIRTTTNNNLTLFTNGNSGQLVLKQSNGNVGIGITSPTKTLQVNGSVGLTTSATDGNKRIHTYPDDYHSWYYKSSVVNNQSADVMTYYQQFLIRHQDSTDVFIIRGNGNVGIGTTSPNNILHVSSAGSDTYVRIGNNAGYDAGLYFNTSTDWTIGTDTSNSNAFTIGNGSSVGANSKVVIQTGGNVGIGTTSPSKKLVVAQSNVTEPSGIDANTGILIKNNTWSGIQIISTEATGGFLTFGDNDAGFRGRIQYTHSNDNMVFETAAGERMRIENDGDVILTEGNLTMSGNTPFIVLSNTAETESGITFLDSADASQSAKITFNSATDNLLKFYNNASNARMTIDSSGKVGIGTTPTEMLHIKGGGSGPEIRLEGTWGSHYIRAYNDNWNFLVGGTVQAINIKNSGAVQIGTTNSGSKLNVGGTIAAATNNGASGMIVPRSYGISWGGSTFTHTFDPVALFGQGFRGGQVLFECTGWRMAMNNGYIMWRNAGGGDPIGTSGSVQYVQTAYNSGGQSGSNTISVSTNSGTNNITITFTGWHTNSHGFMCRITTNYS